MKVICIECGTVKESKFRFDVCPNCRGTMTDTGKEINYYEINDNDYEIIELRKLQKKHKLTASELIRLARVNIMVARYMKAKQGKKLTGKSALKSDMASWLKKETQI